MKIAYALLGLHFVACKDQSAIQIMAQRPSDRGRYHRAVAIYCLWGRAFILSRTFTWLTFEQIPLISTNILPVLCPLLVIIKVLQHLAFLVHVNFTVQTLHTSIDKPYFSEYFKGLSLGHDKVQLRTYIFVKLCLKGEGPLSYKSVCCDTILTGGAAYLYVTYM